MITILKCAPVTCYFVDRLSTELFKFDRKLSFEAKSICRKTLDFTGFLNIYTILQKALKRIRNA